MEKDLEIKDDISSSNALKFVLLLGIVSLFADTTYEGARSIAGPFLEFLGATGLIVGIIAGLGEFFGYSIRIVSGFLSDKMKNYWVITFLGYVINLFAVPLLALAGSWQLAALLMVSERLGKGIRNPPRDAMLSHAGSKLGSGRAFAIHEALDQTGAIIGPLIISAVLILRGNTSYHMGYALLLLPAVFAVGTLVLARFQFPHPKKFETIVPINEGVGFPREYWIFLVAMGLVAAGFADFTIIAYHFEASSVIGVSYVPILYAIAMAVDGFSAIVMGNLFDRSGIVVLAGAAFISSFTAFFAFGSSEMFAIIGIILWGISLGAQETLIGAIIAKIIPKNKRGTAYGLFNAGYGFSWLIGSVIIGYLLDISILSLMLFSFLVQLLAVPLLLYLSKKLS